MRRSRTSQYLADSRDVSARSEDSLESSVWDLLLRASEANLTMRREKSERYRKRANNEPTCDCDYLVESAKKQKDLMLLEAFRTVPAWFAITPDPLTPGFHSLRYLKRPVMFHFPSRMLKRFKEVAKL